VYLYKTAHHPRLETDYKQPAIDAAMATAAAPTFLKPHMTESAVELVDGGVWANNPIGVAAVEAIGMLGWPRDKLKILCRHELICRSAEEMATLMWRPADHPDIQNAVSCRPITSIISIEAPDQWAAGQLPNSPQRANRFGDCRRLQGA
jgi:hypothetical protein